VFHAIRIPQSGRATECILWVSIAYGIPCTEAAESAGCDCEGWLNFFDFEVVYGGRWGNFADKVTTPAVHPRSIVAKKSKAKKASKAKKPTVQPKTMAKFAPSANGVAAKITLDDVRAVKGLLSRIKGEQFKSLIDLFAM
jgi:hypothetical protein